MSDTPERIWTASTRGKCHVGFDTPSMNYTNEYVRADRITALEAQTANQAAAIALLERDIADTWALVNEKDQEIAKIRRDLDTANHQVERLLALSNSMDDDFKAEVAKLSDPNSVQINMLMGRIAKPTFSQMQFVYAAEFREAQRAADALADGVAGKLDILAADFPKATSLFRDLVTAYHAALEARA